MEKKIDRKMEEKILENKDAEIVTGGDYLNPSPQPYPYPYYPGNGPVYGGNPGYPQPPQTGRAIRGYKTRCSSCGKTEEAAAAPAGYGALFTGSTFCSCGGRIEAVEPIYY